MWAVGSPLRTFEATSGYVRSGLALDILLPSECLSDLRSILFEVRLWSVLHVAQSHVGRGVAEQFLKPHDWYPRLRSAHAKGVPAAGVSLRGAPRRADRMAGATWSQATVKERRDTTATIRIYPLLLQRLRAGVRPALCGLSRLVTDGTDTIWAQWRLVPHLRLQLLEEVQDEDQLPSSFPAGHRV